MTKPGDWDALVAAPAATSDDPVATAGAAGRLLPSSVHDALVGFADRPHRSGAVVVHGVPLGEVPATPPSPIAAPPTPVATRALLTAARRLGQPVGYAPEHGGEIVQQIVPTRDAAAEQVSTSSDVELMFHTETAFHPHRPRYLLLLCLRGDPAAATTLASVHRVVERLDAATVDAMFEPRFRTAVDRSFLGGRANRLGPPRPLLEGTLDEPTFVFDADLMVGIDDAADRVIREVRRAVGECHRSVVLSAGDLLVIDNHVAVHGRSPFAPRYDGTDRWLQRTFVVTDLAPSAGERSGRVITTVFGEVA
ncbi:MAG: TauD/TfdA family dioxygenase [Ilumatobacteraceae bacterium]